jgi:formate dehydrogenase subunit delta
VKDSELIRMANQIADFFQPYEAEEAEAGIAEHLKNFWERRMRTQLLTLLAEQPDAFKPVVRRALARLDAEAAAQTG